MRHIERSALALLKEHICPETGRSRLKIKVLGELLTVSEPTAQRIVRRLEDAGQIKRHHHTGRSGADIEIINQDA